MIQRWQAVQCQHVEERSGDGEGGLWGEEVLPPHQEVGVGSLECKPCHSQHTNGEEQVRTQQSCKRQRGCGDNLDTSAIEEINHIIITSPAQVAEGQDQRCCLSEQDTTAAHSLNKGTVGSVAMPPHTLHTAATSYSKQQPVLVL